jgi:hypothetical protein
MLKAVRPTVEYLAFPRTRLSNLGVGKPAVFKCKHGRDYQENKQNHRQNDVEHVGVLPNGALMFFLAFENLHFVIRVSHARPV